MADAFPWEGPWWLKQFGARAKAEWCETTWRMLTESQRRALRANAGLSVGGHFASRRVLRRKGLLTRYDVMTAAGRAVLRVGDDEEGGR